MKEINYERDLEFYTGLQHQVRRPDTPDILKRVLLSYQNHMTRKYDLSLEDLESQSAALHYGRENKAASELRASGELERMIEEKK